MANVMALVSKGVFEAQHRGAKVGDVLPMDRYVSANKGLVPLEEGGSLFLVTVRPPDEALWLVAILESPKFDGKQWTSKKNVEAARDLANVQKSLKFSTGSGLSTKAGALGMSLQTPRTLTDQDVELLRGGATKSEPKKEAKTKKESPPPVVEPVILAEPPKDDAIGRAEAALSTGDRQAALDALLAAWRACRAPELAELIDIVSGDVNRALPQLDVDAKDYVQQWMEVDVLARSIDVPRLIPGLQAEPIGTLGDRVYNLIARGPDPRVGRALVKFVDAIPTTASSRFNVWVRIFDALPTMVDASFAPDFKRFAKKKDEGGNFYPKYFKWLAKLELPEVAELAAGDKKRVEAMTKQAKALAKGPAPLLEKSEVAAKEPAKVTVSALDPSSAIQAALEAMRTAKWEPAMQYLQMAWAKTRDAELAELIEKFSLALQPHLESAPKDHRAWLAREAKHASVDLQPLLDARRAGSDSELVQKLGRLLAWPEDSRLAAYLAEAIDSGYGKTSAEYWTVILDLALKHATPALGALLQENARDIRPEAASHFPYWRPRQRQIVRVHDAFRERLTRFETLPDSARSRFAELRTLFPKAPAHPEAAMIADIVASTSDDPRLVFADWLMEKGDPLGEWISVQCGLAKNPTDKKLLARQKALTKTNNDRRALLGPLSKVIENDPTYIRGMLTRVSAYGDEKSDRIHHANPRLASVEALNLYWVEHETAVSFALSPALVSLRRIQGLKYETMLALAGSKRALSVERIEADVQRNDQTDEERAILADAPGLPALRVLGISFELDGKLPEWILGGALGKRLQKLAVREQSVKSWRKAVEKSGLPIEVIVEDPS